MTTHVASFHQPVQRVPAVTALARRRSSPGYRHPTQRLGPFFSFHYAELTTSPPWCKQYESAQLIPRPSAADSALAGLRASLADHLDAEAMFEVSSLRLTSTSDSSGQATPTASTARCSCRNSAAWRVRTRLRHGLRAVRLPVQGHRGDGRDAYRDTAARDSAHVVRRPGEHAVVGRPVAERVVRRLLRVLRDVPVEPFPARLVDIFGRREDVGLRAGPAAVHPPGSADAATLSEAIANFDGISYAKGAVVLRQLAAYVGRTTSSRGSAAFAARRTRTIGWLTSSPPWRPAQASLTAAQVTEQAAL